MLASFRILASSLSTWVRGAARAFGLSFLHSFEDRLRHGGIGLARGEEKLEKDGPLELFEVVRNLVPGPTGRVPLGDDGVGMGNPDPQLRVSYPAFPDNFM